MGLEHIFTPIQLGPVTVPNRIARQGHALRYFPDITDELIANLVSKADGGTGLSILELGRVHHETYHPWELDLADDRIVDGYARMMARLGSYDMRVFQEVVFYGRSMGPGRRTGGEGAPGGGGPAWSPSSVPHPGGSTPLPMTKAMIDSVVEGFGATARRLREGALHGVEVHCSHGHLVQQFLSPVVNQRTDEYGGTPENRLRFLREILAAVRVGAGPELAVGIRIGHDEGTAGGLTVDDTIWFVRALEADASIDYVDIGIGNALKPHATVAGEWEPHGYQLNKSGPIAEAVDIPAVVGGRVMTLDEADGIIASGRGDLVSMVRALTADPSIVRKTREGRSAEIRPCIACNHACYAPILFGQISGCTVNPSAGRELTMGEELIEPAAVARRVLVAGGGPAGLEAARVAALRGHDVLLCEAGSELGGQVALTSRAPLRTEFGLILEWFERELERLGVEVRTGATVDGSLVASEQAGLVVIATGAIPRRDGFQSIVPLAPVEGVDGPNIHTSWDVLGGATEFGRRVVVLDDIGHYEGIAVVDALFEAGVETIDYVTRCPVLAPGVETSAAAAPARERFGRRDFTFHPRSLLLSVADSTAHVRDAESGRESQLEFDNAVLLCGYQPNRALADELNPAKEWRRNADDIYESAGGHVKLIGDALSSPRFLTVAVREGHRAARTA